MRSSFLTNITSNFFVYLPIFFSPFTTEMHRVCYVRWVLINTYPCDPHFYQSTEYFYYSRGFPVTLPSQCSAPACSAKGDYCSDFYHRVSVLRVLAFHAKGMRSVYFSVRLFSLRLECSHVATVDNTLLPFIAQWHSFVGAKQILFTLLSTDIWVVSNI